MTDVLIPYSFVPGTKAMASEVNANFIALANGVEDCKSFTTQSIDDFNVEMETRLDEAIGDRLEKNFSNSVNVSNCILEIPNRIKVEKTTDGFVLKAGSQAIVPSGFEEDGVTPKFEYVEFSDDTLFGSLTVNATQFFILWQPNNTAHPNLIETYYTESGTTSTLTTQWRVWYDTANNVVKRTDNGGATWVSGFSLPIMIMTNDGSKWTSVDTVFNGFGYIGQCLWVDKDVKALFADGRNEDGTLKNKEVVTTKIKINDETGLKSWLGLFHSDGNFGSYGVKNYFEQDTAPAMGNSQHGWWFNTRENLMYQTSDYGATWTLNQAFLLGDLIKENNGNFTSMSIRKPLRVVDYEDLKEVDIFPTAFGTRINIASGWTATSNGVVYFEAFTNSDANGRGCFGYIDNQIVYENLQDGDKDNHHQIGSCAPIFKGQKVTTSVTNGGFTVLAFSPYKYN